MNEGMKEGRAAWDREVDRAIADSRRKENETFKIRGRKLDSRGRTMQTAWVERTDTGWKLGSATAFSRSDASVALGWARQHHKPASGAWQWELRYA